MNLQELLSKNKSAFSPLFKPGLSTDNTLFMDFSHTNPEMKDLDFTDMKAFNDFVFDKIKEQGNIYGYGGYMEDREIYRRSALFAGEKGQPRSIHLGIDVWAPAGTAVYCPCDAQVHSFRNNAAFGDYGPTIILEHELEGISFYTLYGHLSRNSLTGLKEGQKIPAGAKLCEIGNFPENGDWPPHLHFQVISDMQDKKGDFYGVCRKDDVEVFKNICPNPVVFFEF